ncbi:MAG: hypothetical protein K2Y56_07645 [Methylobacterium sp.]|nr:hypothetical protein [Methylobacterium sp.]MBX9931397.1 hypothetical protein [Methylobacterium sp.]
MADVAGDEEGRGGVLGIEQEDVAFRLPPRVLHHHVPAAGGGAAPEVLGLVGEQVRLRLQGVLLARQARLLRLQDEMPALVEVDALGRRAAVALARSHRSLEHVIIAGGVGPSGVGRLDAKDAAQLGEEHLVVRALGAALARRPARDEILDVHARSPQLCRHRSKLARDRQGGYRYRQRLKSSAESMLVWRNLPFTVCA